jgi:DNA-binding CsgD family transcriptional regulator
MDIAEGLLHLDPVRTYPQRGAALVAKLAGASAYRLTLDGDDEIVESTPKPSDSGEVVELPLRNGRQSLGTLTLHLAPEVDKLGQQELRMVRWGARVLSRGVAYSRRLAAEGGRRNGEDLHAALERAPLTPRERDVVALLVGGSSTREIASKTGLTVATVNTYLKRIFSKLGVHSRVELVARMAGTDGVDPGPVRSKSDSSEALA